jgi:hypothetical protein
MDYFLTASALAGALASLLTSALAGVLAAGAGAVTAGLASTFFSSFLGASAAKAETAKAVAMRAINCFIVISFDLKLARICLAVYTTPQLSKGLTRFGNFAELLDFVARVSYNT